MIQHWKRRIMNYSTTLLLAFALCCLFVSLATWFVFLRPVPRQTVSGVITQNFQAGQYLLAVPHRHPGRFLDACSNPHR